MSLCTPKQDSYARGISAGPINRALRALLASAIVVGVCLAALTASARVPNDIVYQGVLTDESGAPVEGPMDLEIRIYGDPFSDQPLYAELKEAVPVAGGGQFSIRIGTGMPKVGTFDPSLFYDLNRYVEIASGGRVLSQRQPLASVPWAMVAQDVLIGEDTHLAMALAGIRTLAGDAMTTADRAEQIAQAALAGQDARPSDHALSADHANTADKATLAIHAYTADHATTADQADYATKAGHARTADQAQTAGHALTAGHATTADTAMRADTAAVADTLSASLCSEGQILVKGPTEWECADPAATPIPLFVHGVVAIGRRGAPMPLYSSPSTCCTENLEAADGLLPRGGVLTSLNVSPRTARPSDSISTASRPIPTAGTVAAVTLMVNGVATALTATHSVDLNGTNAVSNLTARVTVQAGDRIALKFERVAGQCDRRQGRLYECGDYRASLLLE